PSHRRSRRCEILQDASSRQLEVLKLLPDRALFGREKSPAAGGRAGVFDLRFDGLAFPPACHRPPFPHHSDAWSGIARTRPTSPFVSRTLMPWGWLGERVRISWT